MAYPKKILHWINNKETAVDKKGFFDKFNPATHKVLTKVAKGGRADIDNAITSGERAYKIWSSTSVVKRGKLLRDAALLIQKKRDELAEIVALESGKPKSHSRAEVDAAVECGLFIAGEGRRFFGETLESAVLNREVKLIRQSIGVGALITPFNNPAAGVAWKLFPALLCGNCVILKSHEYTPYVAVWFAKIFKTAGLAKGAISVIQGSGREAGASIVNHERVSFISFTGSAFTGQRILKAAAPRLAKVLIEAGGKNPFVVCDDADLERAAELAVQSAFVDGGQRCAAASRIIVFKEVYDKFKKLFLEKVKRLKVGTADTDDFGAIISEKRMKEILKAINGAVTRGGKLLTGGKRLDKKEYKKGYFLEPTVFERISPKDKLSQEEIFGPVVALYKVKGLSDAIKLANNSDFKLTSAIHTRSIDKAEEFIANHYTGVVRVNGPTHGSEPHFPFGGVGLSGNGWREPGTKALDFYSEWKQVSVDR